MQADIQNDLKKAMLASEKNVVMVLRGLLASIQNAEIEKKTQLTDDEVIRLLQKEVKKRVEAAEMYARGGSIDREQAELAEKRIIEAYLPEQLDQSDIENLVSSAIDELEATSLADMGKVIAQVRSKTGGQADGALIAKVTKEKLGSAA
jgi:uncharacterized protein YqeY